MGKAVFVLDTSHSGCTQAGVVWAGFCLCIGGRKFPHERWTDFVVVVLSWWVQALLALFRDARDRQEIMFMEGPFCVEIQAVSENAWRLTCIERGARPITRDEIVVDVRGFLESAVETGEKVLALCRSNGWWSSDADRLHSLLCELNVAMAKIGI